jgi:hypothetical protein
MQPTTGNGLHTEFIHFYQNRGILWLIFLLTVVE